MANLFRSSASRHPLRPAVVSNGIQLTYAEVDARTDRVAEALTSRGVVAGTIIGTLLDNGVTMIELLIAAAKLRATVLAMNWRLAAAELEYVFGDAQPGLCFVSERFESLAVSAVPRCDLIVVVDEPGGVVGALAGGAIDHAAASQRSPATAHPDDRWYLLYTSGTTGRPKGCLHTQGGYFVNALSLAGFCGFRETDRHLLANPLFHVAGLSTFVAMHAVGACVVVPPPNLTTEDTLRLTSLERITVESLPVLAPAEYLDLQERLGLALELRLVVGGGGMNPPRLLERIRDVLGVDMVLGYGQSEVGGFSSLIRLADQLDRPTSCGRTMAHLDARIVDDQGTDVAPAASGELLVRGPSVTTEYNNLPDATAEAITDGWLHSGDIFRRDADGFLYFTGRLKELVKTGGENVYPAEVEQVLGAHPAVVDCCVVGVPHQRWGEAVKAFVVLRAGTGLTPAEAAAWCRGRMAGYKRPRFVELVDAIPRNFQGKAQRAALAALPVRAEQAADPADIVGIRR